MGRPASCGRSCLPALRLRKAWRSRTSSREPLKLPTSWPRVGGAVCMLSPSGLRFVMASRGGQPRFRRAALVGGGAGDGGREVAQAQGVGEHEDAGEAHGGGQDGAEEDAEGRVEHAGGDRKSGV